MFGPIEIAARLFEGPDDLGRSMRALGYLMAAMAEINREWLEAHPEAPALYESGVIYRPERHTETWQDYATTLAKGYGDCEDLATARLGELRVQGIPAIPHVTGRRVGRRNILHALVRWPDGKIEDPSRALGMHGHPLVARPVFIDARDPARSYVAWDWTPPRRIAA